MPHEKLWKNYSILYAFDIFTFSSLTSNKTYSICHCVKRCRCIMHCFHYTTKFNINPMLTFSSMNKIRFFSRLSQAKPGLIFTNPNTIKAACSTLTCGQLLVIPKHGFHCSVHLYSYTVNIHFFVRKYLSLSYFCYKSTIQPLKNTQNT